MKTRRKKSKPVKEDPITAVEIVEVDNQCLVCEAEFLDEDDLKIHVEQMHKEGLVVCKFCEANLPGHEEFVTHFVRVHLDKAVFCSYCYRVFSNKISHQQHEIRHCFISENRVSCSQCRKIFNRRQLQKHEYEKHADSDDGLMLNRFFSLLSSSLNMSAVKFFDAVIKKEPFRCNRCNYYSQNVFDYVAHLKSSSCQSFVCDNCCKVFKIKRGLISHCLSRQGCGNTSNISVKCSKCNKEFESDLFAEHKDACKAEKCSTCGVIFSSINSLTEHRIKEHSVSQAVSIQLCIFCKKEFVGEANLKKHIERSHKDVSKYKYGCSHCDALFTHPKRLFGHYYTKHRDIHPYTCKICDKTFRIRKRFTFHIKLEHKSVGFVEFDENLHVIFTDKKSEKPFQPEIPEGLYGDTEDVETAPLSDQDKTQETPRHKLNDQNKTERTPHRKLNDQDKTKPAPHHKLNDLNKTQKTPHHKLNDQNKTLETPHRNLNDQIKIQETPHHKLNDENNTQETPHHKLNDQIKTQESPNPKLNDQDLTQSDSTTKKNNEQIESTLTQVTTGPMEFNIEIDVTVESSQETNLSETDTQTVESEEKIQELLPTSTSREVKEKPENDSEDMEIQQESVTNKDKENQTSPNSRLLRKRRVTRIKHSPSKRQKKVIDITTESSDDEPLSNIRDTVLKIQTERKSRKGMKYKTNKSKLTCKICSKFCYTYQNYHHHMSLHMKSKLKRCVKCLEFFKSGRDLQNHIETAHSSSKLTETLKSLLEKRKQELTSTANTKQLPAMSLKQLIEDRKRTAKQEAQNTLSNRFKRTIKKVDVSDSEQHKTTITPMTDHGISVKKFIENFRPDGGDTINISSSVTFKILNSPVEKQTTFKLKKMSTESPITGDKLKWPAKFKDSSTDVKSNVTVKLVQELITKPRFLNFTIDERIPTIEPPPPEKEYDEYCNTFADETDYTQYKNDATIPEVAQEVMLAADDIPRTKRLAQEIIIPNIPEEYGEVSIGHLLPQAPYYKIVTVKKLLKQEPPPPPVVEPKFEEKNIKLPDGTQLVTVNPFSHLLPTNHLEEVLKANRNKYYRPRVRNMETALMKALNNLKHPRSRSKEYANRNKKRREMEAESVSIETTDSNSTECSEMVAETADGSILP